jgi:hypothetical protein
MTPTDDERPGSPGASPPRRRPKLRWVPGPVGFGLIALVVGFVAGATLVLTESVAPPPKKPLAPSPTRRAAPAESPVDHAVAARSSDGGTGGKPAAADEPRPRDLQRSIPSTKVHGSPSRGTGHPRPPDAQVEPHDRSEPTAPQPPPEPGVDRFRSTDPPDDRAPLTSGVARAVPPDAADVGALPPQPAPAQDSPRPTHQLPSVPRIPPTLTGPSPNSQPSAASSPVPAVAPAPSAVAPAPPTPPAAPSDSTAAVNPAAVPDSAQLPSRGASNKPDSSVTPVSALPSNEERQTDSPAGRAPARTPPKPTSLASPADGQTEERAPCWGLIPKSVCARTSAPTTRTEGARQTP